MKSGNITPTGRFAPSPTGRMHLGNVFAAMMSWLSVRSRGGRWILRIEDLDPQRSRRDYARQIESDLRLLGLDWDEGGLACMTSDGYSYIQSERTSLYAEALRKLTDAGLTYRCRCTRAALRATQAPHASDGILVYPGTCRPISGPPFAPDGDTAPAAIRLFFPDRDLTFTDARYGTHTVNLARDCGDTVLRRADGAFAYQLAVSVDDALMGVTEVVRGVDLLMSSPRQIFIHRLLGFEPPAFAHIPLLTNAEGIRLSKRDSSLSLQALLSIHSPAAITGYLAYLARIIPEPMPMSPADMLPYFNPASVPAIPAIPT